MGDDLAVAIFIKIIMSTRITGHTVYDACALLILSLLVDISQHIDMTSKPLKNKMIEVFTKLKYTDVEESKKKALFELLYSTVVEIEDTNVEKNEIEKFILCDLQVEVFPKIREAFVQILRHSGFPEANFSGEIDFLKLYQQRSNQ